MCFYHYNDGDHEPKILPCSGAHDLCLACLKRLQTPGASFLCPVCREEILADAKVNTNRSLLAALALMKANVTAASAAMSQVALASPPSTEPAEVVQPAGIAQNAETAQPAESAPAAAAASATGVPCSVCKQRLARSAFSRAQLGKSASTRRCSACIGSSVAPTTPSPSGMAALLASAPVRPPPAQPAPPPPVQELAPPPPVPELVAPPAVQHRLHVPVPAPPTAPACPRNFACDYSHVEPSTSMRIFSSPATPLPFQRLEGGGGPPLHWAEFEVKALCSAELPTALQKDRLDLQPEPGQLFDKAGIALGGRGLPEGFLDAHVTALGATTTARARAALALYPACCPQAHLVLAHTEATCVEAAIPHLERAVEHATTLLRLLCGSTPRAASVAYRASAGRRESFWGYVLARPWFRAHLRLGNALRCAGRYEAALGHYMALVDVDGHCWCSHNTYVNYRFFVPSTLLLLGRPRAAKKFILETCAPVHTECFTMASTQLAFQMDLALAEYMVCRAEGRVPKGCFTGPRAIDPAVIVPKLPQEPHLIFSIVVQFCGAAVAILLDCDDGPYALPDLDTMPPNVGASTGYSQALTYLSGGVHEMWCSVDGALDFFRRYRHHFWALQWLRGRFNVLRARPVAPFEEPPGLDASVVAFERLLSRGVLPQKDACRLLVEEAVIDNDCCDVGCCRAEAAIQVRILRSVLAAPGLRFVDLGPRSADPTTLGKAMYHDCFPLGFTYLLASAGATLWWKQSESTRQVCPLQMAANQGNWRQLALGLNLMAARPDETVVWGDVMDVLSDTISTSSCLPCLIDPTAPRCNRCRYDSAHSDECDFEKCIDVLVYYGLRSWRTYTGEAAWRINERYRCRIAETRGLAVPSVVVRRVLASGGMDQYISDELANGTMSQAVHDVLVSAVASGVRTQSELLSEWRPKVFAAFDRDSSWGCSSCAQCESDRYGCPQPPMANAENAPRKQTSKCQRCRSVWYCSTQCQKAHWAVHKRVCNKPFADIDAVLEEAYAARCDSALPVQ